MSWAETEKMEVKRMAAAAMVLDWNMLIGIDDANWNLKEVIKWV